MSNPGEQLLDQILSDIDSNEINLWIVTGVLSGFSIILFMLVVILLVGNSRLKKRMSRLEEDWNKWGKGLPVDAVNPMHQRYQQGSGYGGSQQRY